MLGLGFVLAVSIAACGHDDDDSELFSSALQAAVLQDCGLASKNLTIQSIMADWYFWIEEQPATADPFAFGTPEAYLDALRFLPLDRFSFLNDAAADEAFFSESQFIGFGFRQSIVNGDQLFFIDVFAGSPADAAGLMRGFEILEINGETVASLIASGELADAYGPSEIGVQATIRYRDPDTGTEDTVTLTKDLVTIPTVAITDTFDVNGTTVGYILFQNFVQPSFDALDDAFEQLQAAGATELILDLRYNGGGLISVAQHLGSLIAGTNATDEVFVTLIHNEKHTANNVSGTFLSVNNALNLNRLTVITTGASASASELVINSLEGVSIPVTVIGDTTFGKPVGQYGFEFCDKVLHPVSFETVNAAGIGGYFDGFAPDCPAEDDITRQLGDAQEASLAEALAFIGNGQCTVTSAAVAKRRAFDKPVVAHDAQYGWGNLLNAY